MDKAELRTQVAIIKAAKTGCCTYCHRGFGSLVRWHGRNLFLGEEADHVVPRVLGGKITVPCCSLCNRIKGAKMFESLADIQDFCLDRLLKDGSVTISQAKAIRLEVTVGRESVNDKELEELRSEARLGSPRSDVEGLLSVEILRRTRRIADRTRQLERDYATQMRALVVQSMQKKARGRKRRPDSFDIESLPEPKS